MTRSATLRGVRDAWKRGLKRRLGRGDRWSHHAFLRPELLDEHPSELSPPGRNLLDRRLRQDFFESIVPGWLHLEDRISMAHSIEARLPFLDYRLVEFAYSLPNHFKIQGGTTKRILRKAMESRLPASIHAESKKKMYTGARGTWLRGPLRPLVQEIFFDSTPMLAEYVDLAGLRAHMGRVADPRSDLRRMWLFLSAELWMRQYFGASVDVQPLGRRILAPS